MAWMGISRAEAIRVCGTRNKFEELILLLVDGRGEMALLLNGSKLVAGSRGAVRRYGIYGYHSEGGDTKEIVGRLAAGERGLLAWPAR